MRSTASKANKYIWVSFNSCSLFLMLKRFWWYVPCIIPSHISIQQSANVSIYLTNYKETCQCGRCCGRTVLSAAFYTRSPFSRWTAKWTTVSFENCKWKYTPNSFVAAYIATHLILRYYNIFICYSEHGYVATFVNIFTYLSTIYYYTSTWSSYNILHNIDVSFKRFEQYWQVRHNPMIVFFKILSF